MSSIIPDSEITRMRADLEDVALPDTCNILSLTKISDGMGGMTETWGTATANVSCRLDNKGGGKANAAQSIQDFSAWVLTVPYATTITPQNRVSIGGDTYTIGSVSDDGSWLACKRATLQKVTL